MIVTTEKQKAEKEKQQKVLANAWNFGKASKKPAKKIDFQSRIEKAGLR